MKKVEKKFKETIPDPIKVEKIQKGFFHRKTDFFKKFGFRILPMSRNTEPYEKSFFSR